MLKSKTKQNRTVSLGDLANLAVLFCFRLFVCAVGQILKHLDLIVL